MPEGRSVRDIGRARGCRLVRIVLEMMLIAGIVAEAETSS